jgi:uncharacterized membrane protein
LCFWIIIIIMLAATATVVKHGLSSSQLRWAAGGWIFFIAENVILSENRTFLIETFGDAEYHGLYGTFSTAACASIAYAYFYRLTPIAAVTAAATSRSLPIVVSTIASWMLLSSGMIMASQSIPTLQNPLEFRSSAPPSASAVNVPANNTRNNNDTPSSSWQLRVRCPFDFVDSSSRMSTTSEEPRGLDRISRHPGLWSFGLIGLGHAMLLPPMAYAQRLWWCGPAAVAWMGGNHTDSRYRRGMGGTLSPEQDAVTSNVPFWAMISGQQGSHAWYSLTEEIKPTNALLATGVATWWVVSTLRRRQQVAMKILRAV